MPVKPSQRRRLLVLVAVVALVGVILPVAPVSAATEACPSTIPSAGYRDLAGLSNETIEAINCIAYYGIAEGVTTSMFDPSSVVPRWQMALFLVRTADDLGIPLPSGSDQGFTDLANLASSTRTAINQLAQLGITKGVSTGRFAPFDPVPRWQMALFLTRLYAKAGLTLPSGASQGFTDIDSLSVEAWYAVNQLAQLGITRGVNALEFGPYGHVFRWQMALFLARQLHAANARPLVVTVVPDASTALPWSTVTLTVLIRNVDGTGVPNQYVDVFVGSLDSARQCVLDADAYLNGSDAGTGINCRIDTGDPRTDASGVATVTFTHSGVTETDTVYAWIGDDGQTFDADIVRTYGTASVQWTLTSTPPPTSGSGFILEVDTDNNAYYRADVASCTSVKLTYGSSDKFFVNGTTATLGGFETELDKLEVTGALTPVAGNNGTMVRSSGSHSLTTGVKVLSGVVGTVNDFTTGQFEFHEPVSGTTLATYTPGAFPESYTLFTVDGANATVQAFRDGISVGDSVSVTGGDGTTAAKTRTYALTNRTVSGTVNADVDAAVSQDITIDTACEQFTVNTEVVAGDLVSSFTIDGTSGKTELDFNTAATAYDSITYGRAAKKATWTLGQAQAPYVGRVSSITAPNVTIAKSSTSTRVVDWTSVATLRRNGVLVVAAEWEPAVSLGDSITYQADNPSTTTDESSLSLTNAAFSGKPKTFADPAIALIINGQTSETVSINDTAPADLRLATVGTGTVKYSTNGSAASNSGPARDAFVAGVNAIIAGVFPNGTVTVAQVGNDIVWSVSAS